MPAQARTDPPETPTGLLVLDYGPDGRWRWCYREPDNDLELYGNQSFETSDEAAESARMAYPGVPFD